MLEDTYPSKTSYLHSGGRLSFALLKKHIDALEQCVRHPLTDDWLRAVVRRDPRTIVVR